VTIATKSAFDESIMHIVMDAHLSNREIAEVLLEHLCSIVRTSSPHDAEQLTRQVVAKVRAAEVEATDAE
jgi:hypothetical protein